MKYLAIILAFSTCMACGGGKGEDNPTSSPARNAAKGRGADTSSAEKLPEETALKNEQVDELKNGVQQQPGDRESGVGDAAQATDDPNELLNDLGPAVPSLDDLELALDRNEGDSDPHEDLDLALSSHEAGPKTAPKISAQKTTASLGVVSPALLAAFLYKKTDHLFESVRNIRNIEVSQYIEELKDGNKLAGGNTSKLRALNPLVHVFHTYEELEEAKIVLPKPMCENSKDSKNYHSMLTKNHSPILNLRAWKDSGEGKASYFIVTSKDHKDFVKYYENERYLEKFSAIIQKLGETIYNSDFEKLEQYLLKNRHVLFEVRKEHGHKPKDVIIKDFKKLCNELKKVATLSYFDKRNLAYLIKNSKTYFESMHYNLQKEYKFASMTSHLHKSFEYGLGGLAALGSIALRFL